MQYIIVHCNNVYPCFLRKDIICEHVCRSTLQRKLQSMLAFRIFTDSMNNEPIHLKIKNAQYAYIQSAWSDTSSH